MDPHQFLDFARRMRRQHVVNEETDSRVGVDRSYYAAALVTWGTLCGWTRTVLGDASAKDLELLSEYIHSVIRFVLQKIDSPYNSMIRELFGYRKRASYFMSACVDYDLLDDAIDLAQKILGGQRDIAVHLNRAYDRDLIDGSSWEDMKARLDKRPRID